MSNQPIGSDDAETRRRFVKPAHDGARIPDPDHPGLDLPQSGAEVPWDHYWIAREKDGDIMIADPADAAAAEALAAPPASEVTDPAPASSEDPDLIAH